MLKITDLEKRFSQEFSLKIPKLTIEKGERVALIGANGSGKSTLLRLIAKTLTPDRGSIEISQDTKVGYSPQSPFVFRSTVEGNIRLCADSACDMNALLDRFELTELRNKKANSLSGGEKQRMCLARILSGGFDLLLLDEPLSAADIETGEMLEWILTEECEKKRTTLIMSTHLPSQAFRTATRVLIMNNGEIAEDLSKEQFGCPKSEFGKKFLSQWRL